MWLKQVNKNIERKKEAGKSSGKSAIVKSKIQVKNEKKQAIKESKIQAQNEKRQAIKETKMQAKNEKIQARKAKIQARKAKIRAKEAKMQVKNGKKEACEFAKKGVFFVKMEGYAGSRVLNIARKRKGKITHFRIDDGIIQYVHAGVSKTEIYETARVCGGKIVEISDVGIFAKAKRATPAMLAVVVFVAVILISNLFVFKIVVSGEDEAAVVHIENMASEAFPFFSLKNSETLEDLKSDIAEYSGVAFCEVQIYQNTLYISFIGSQNGEVEITQQNVVAPESGEIISLVTLSGTANKKVGDIVQKGDILISAVVGNEVKQAETTTASGVGVILVSRSATYSFSLEEVQKYASGNSETEVYFSVGDVDILKTESEFENYYISSKSYSNIIAGLKMVKETRVEMVENTVINSEEDLRERGILLFSERYLADFAYTISNMQATSSVENGVCEVVITCEYQVEFKV